MRHISHKLWFRTLEAILPIKSLYITFVSFSFHFWTLHAPINHYFPFHVCEIYILFSTCKLKHWTCMSMCDIAYIACYLPILPVFLHMAKSHSFLGFSSILLYNMFHRFIYSGSWPLWIYWVSKFCKYTAISLSFWFCFLYVATLCWDFWLMC